MFCNHETEDATYGSDAPPCPFCGFGGSEPDQASENPRVSAFEDSNDALRHAMFEASGSGDTSGPDVFW